MRDHLGPLFERAGVKTKLQTPEFLSQKNAYWNAPTVLDDPGARRYLTALAYHGYDEPVANTEWARAMVALYERYPDLLQWMIEYCHAYQAGTSKTLALSALSEVDDDLVLRLRPGLSATRRERHEHGQSHGHHFGLPAPRLPRRADAAPVPGPRQSSRGCAVEGFWLA